MRRRRNFAERVGISFATWLNAFRRFADGLRECIQPHWQLTDCNMTRSINIVLACVAMLAAAALAYVLTPHRLMARTHDVFDIDAHVPRAFGEWSALPGLQAIKPPPDGLEAEIYNQEVSRAYVDKEGTASC